MVTPSGPFIHYDSVDKYLKDNEKYYMNNELIDYAKSHDYQIPDNYFLMPVVKNYMTNDNVKFHVQHRWNPDSFALYLTEKAISRIYEYMFIRKEVLTFDEAISLAEKSTSAGYLFKKRKLLQKKDVFEHAYNLLKSMYEKVLDGESVETIFEIAPKVEIRKIEKLLSADMSKRKQRTFVVGDTLLYIVGISLYHNQNEAIYSKADSSREWNGVGATMFYGGWDKLARNLLSKSHLFDCLDETAMESCVQGYIMEFIYKNRNLYFQGRSINMARWYMSQMLYGIVIDHYGDLFLKISQNPSGHYNTLVDNVLALVFRLLYHLAKDCMNVDELVSKYYDACVKVVGDDSIIPHQPMWIGVVESGIEIGFTTTYETQLQPLHRSKFLSMGFSYDTHAMMYTFIPDFDKMLASLFYYRKSNSWRLTLSKLYALKMMFSVSMNRYHEICSYIDYVITNHLHDMISEKLDEKLTMHSLMMQNKSLGEIRALLFNLD